MNIEFLTLFADYELWRGCRADLIEHGVDPGRVHGVGGARTIASGYNALAKRYSGADAYCFIHEDARLKFDILRHLPAYLAALPECGALGFVGSAKQRPGEWWWDSPPLFGSVCWAAQWSGGPTLSFGAPTQDLDPAQRLAYEPVETLDGLCLVMRRPAFEAAGGFDEGYDAWHGYDMDICARLLRAGCQNYVIGQPAHHIHRGPKPTEAGQRSHADAMRALALYKTKWESYFALRRGGYYDHVKGEML